MFVSAQRLDVSFTPVCNEILVPVDTQTQTAINRPITLLGTFAKQARLDPNDERGHTVLVLTNGIERIDLASGKVTWAVDSKLFEAQGMFGFHIQAFAMHGNTAYVAASVSDFSQVDIWRVTLDENPSLEKVLSGYNSFEKVLEVVGDQLWIGDTTIGESGLRAFDLTENPPKHIAGPLSTGLPPYSMIAIP